MNEILKALEQRRSVRSYQERPVEPEKLEQLLKAGLGAPSARNLQPWHISVVRGREDIGWMESKIREALLLAGNKEQAEDPDFHTFYGAPVVLYVSGDAENRYYVGDSANLVTYLSLAAYGLGLGSCYIASSQIMFQCPDQEEIRKKLQIPEGYEPVFSLAVGYAAGEWPQPRDRKEDAVHFVD